MFEQIATRPPPHNIEAEQSLLGFMLANSAAHAHFSFLEAKHFYEPVHQEIFTAMHRLREDGMVADPITLKRYFEKDSRLEAIGGSRYLASLMSHSLGVFWPEDYAKEIHNAASLRKIHEACNAALDAIAVGNATAEVVAAEMSSLTGDILGKQESQRVMSDRQVAEAIAEDLKTARAVTSTGLSKLDSAMGGGLHAGKAYGFAARKKVGKTMLAGTISYNLAQQKIKHLFICGEMGSKEIHQRTMARQMDVFPSAFRSDYGKSADFSKRFSDAIGDSSGCILYQDAPGLTFDDLKRYVTAALHQHKIQGIILDYWQLVGGKPARKNLSEHLDEVAQWIANAGRRMGFWSITMGQINQDGNTRGGEGMRLAFDQVYQIHREDVTMPQTWLEMMDTRYTAWTNIGSKEIPGLLMSKKGTHFEEFA